MAHYAALWRKICTSMIYVRMHIVEIEFMAAFCTFEEKFELYLLNFKLTKIFAKICDKFKMNH